MSLVISLGSNLGDKVENINRAKKELTKYFKLKEESRIYQSKAVDYESQPDFLNQVLVFVTPKIPPSETLKTLLSVESFLGRTRSIPKGPRVIDIDLLFYDETIMRSQELEIPHPRLFQRSFIVLPLKELTVFNTLSKNFNFPNSFCNDAFPLN